MVKSSNKNATKSFIMLIVTGVVLVAVTLCWFMINKMSSVDELEREVERKALQSKLYCGISENDDTATARNDVYGYKMLDDSVITIRLENMVPGVEYFFRAVCQCKEGQKISLKFTGIEDDGLGDMITVYSTVKKIADDADDFDFSAEEDNDTNIPDEEDSVDFNVLLDNVVEDKVVVCEQVMGTDEQGVYAIYFSFKFEDEATIGGEELDDGSTSVDYRNKTITISAISAIVENVE